MLGKPLLAISKTAQKLSNSVPSNTDEITRSLLAEIEFERKNLSDSSEEKLLQDIENYLLKEEGSLDNKTKEALEKLAKSRPSMVGKLREKIEDAMTSQAATVAVSNLFNFLSTLI